MKGRWWRIKSNRHWTFLREPRGFTQVHDRGIKAEGFSAWGVTGIWTAQFFIVWKAPPKDKMCSISGPWPPNAHGIHQPLMWPLHLHFECQLEGGSIPCREEMIIILPLLKPLSEKNFWGKISTLLSEAKFLTNYLTDLMDGALPAAAWVRQAEGYV